MKKEDKYMNILPIENGNKLRSISPYVYYDPGNLEIVLDGDFSIEELEAIIFWMKKHQNKKS